MRSIRTGDLVKLLTAGVGVTGAQDTIYFALEDALTIIFDQPWSWNWKKSGYITHAPHTTVDTFTCAIGDSALTSAINVTVPIAFTGRKVKIGDEWYRVIDIGLTNPLKMILDRPVATEITTATTVTLYRDELAIRSVRIGDVKIDGSKIDRLSPFFNKTKYVGTYFERDAGTPGVYIAYDDITIPPPSYPPVVTPSGSATFPSGKYYYFYTRVDTESGLESKPGPAIAYDCDGAFKPSISYDNPSGNQSESLTYKLRLYRSQRDPGRSRCPMFLIQERDPGVVAAFVDTNGTVYNLPQYWDGPFSVLEFFSKPDSTRRSVRVEYIGSHYYRPYDEEMLSLGVESQVTELLRTFIAGCVNLGGRDSKEYRSSVIQFRQQLAYLVSKSRNSGEGDLGPENYNSTKPGVNQDEDWIESLPWRS